MHAFVFWNLVGFTTLRFSFLKSGAILCSSFCEALPPPLELPTFSLRFLDGFITFTIVEIDEKHASQFSRIIELWLFVCPFLLFFF